MTKRQQGVSHGTKRTLAKVAGGAAAALCLALIGSAVPPEIFAAASPWNEVAPPQGATPGARPGAACASRAMPRRSRSPSGPRA